MEIDRYFIVGEMIFSKFPGMELFLGIVLRRKSTLYEFIDVLLLDDNDNLIVATDVSADRKISCWKSIYDNTGGAA